MGHKASYGVDYRPLTNTTWADVDNRVSRTTDVYWDQQADLVHALADMTHLDVSQCRLLVNFAHNGLPLVLTFTTRLHGGRTETTKTTVLVDSISAPRTTSSQYPGSPGELRIRYCGFAHGVDLPRIVNVENVANEVTFS